MANLPKSPSYKFGWRTVEMPQNLVDRITPCTYDPKTLRWFSLTCPSWNFPPSSRLDHYSLKIELQGRCERKEWYKPLRRSYELGLLPFIKQFSVVPSPSGYITEFTPEYLSGRSLRYFSALKNLRELRIDGLQLPSFIPHIEKRFGHFAPTLQTLVLNELKASCRQILYSIGHFRELQNLGLRHLDSLRKI